MELYARFGVEGVSLRAVNEHSGSQNHSAAHYHFKTKEKFIEHIIAYMFDIEKTELDEYVETHGRQFSGVEGVIFSMMAPLLVIYDNREWGRNALKFLAVLLISTEANKLTLWSKSMVSRNADFIDALSKYLPNRKPSDLKLRASFMYINLIVSLASDEATENTVFGDLSGVSEDKQFAHLFAYCAGGMTQTVI